MIFPAAIKQTNVCAEYAEVYVHAFPVAGGPHSLRRMRFTDRQELSDYIALLGRMLVEFDDARAMATIEAAMGRRA